VPLELTGAGNCMGVGEATVERSAMGVLTNAMLIRMTRMTKRNQVLLGIFSGLAPQVFVVNF